MPGLVVLEAPWREGNRFTTIHHILPDISIPFTRPATGARNALHFFQEIFDYSDRVLDIDSDTSYLDYVQSAFIRSPHLSIRQLFLCHAVYPHAAARIHWNTERSDHPCVPNPYISSTHSRKRG